MTISPRIVAIIAACLLASCIDGHEEVWLETNGSGRAEISYSLPKAAARFQGGEAGVRKMIAKFLADNPAILSSSHRVSTEGEQLKIFIRVSFDATQEFKDTKTLPSSAAAMAGEVKIHTHSRTVDFERRISPGSALPGAAFLPPSTFQGRSLRYTLHLPIAALESNATRSENSGRTLIWDFPLAAAIHTPITTRYVVKMPLSPWLIAAVAPTLLLAGGLTFLGLRRLRQMRHPVESQ